MTYVAFIISSYYCNYLHLDAIFKVNLMRSFNITNITKLFGCFFKTDLGIALIIAITWQVGMTLVGILLDSSLSNIFQAKSRPDGPITLLSHTSNWDSNWYLVISKDWYHTNLASSVFYPLFPLLLMTLNVVSFGLVDQLLIGFILNTIALFLAIFALVKIADFFVAKKYRWWVVAIFLASPAAIFLHFLYTEAIFCAIAFWAYLFALRREWWKMAVLLAILTSARLPAILFIALCALEFLRSYSWNIRKAFNKNILWFIITPAGFVLYGLYLQIIRHDFFGMFNGYHHTKDWSYQIFDINIFETWIKVASGIYKSPPPSIAFDEGVFVNAILPLVTIGLLLISSLYAVLKMRKTPAIPLALFSILAITMFSLNSNLVSVHRYALPVVILYITFVHFISSKKLLSNVFYVTIYLSIILQTSLYILYVSSYFAG